MKLVIKGQPEGGRLNTNPDSAVETMVRQEKELFLRAQYRQDHDEFQRGHEHPHISNVIFGDKSSRPSHVRRRRASSIQLPRYQPTMHGLITLHTWFQSAMYSVQTVFGLPEHLEANHRQKSGLSLACKTPIPFSGHCYFWRVKLLLKVWLRNVSLHLPVSVG